MQRVILFKLADESFRTPKLFASLLMVFSLLMFFSAGAEMLESWDNIKVVNNCLSTGSYSDTTKSFSVCQSTAGDAFGFYVRTDQSALTNKQIGMALMRPIGMFFFWAAILILSFGIYRTGKITIPIRQSIKESHVAGHKKKK